MPALAVVGSFSLLQACHDCPSELHVELSADATAGVLALDTSIHVTASSHAWPSSGGDACDSGDVRIKAYRWDFDDDGKFDRSTSSSAAQDVHLTGVGKHLVRIEIEDAQGNKAHAELELEVIDDRPRSALGTVEVEIVAYPDAPACAERLCIRARTGLSSLELDALQVVAAGATEPLLEVQHPTLDPDSQELACASLAASTDLDRSPVASYAFAGETYSRDSDWSARRVCPDGPAP